MLWENTAQKSVILRKMRKICLLWEWTIRRVQAEWIGIMRIGSQPKRMTFIPEGCPPPTIPAATQSGYAPGWWRGSFEDSWVDFWKLRYRKREVPGDGCIDPPRGLPCPGQKRCIWGIILINDTRSSYWSYSRGGFRARSKEWDLGSHAIKWY